MKNPLKRLIPLVFTLGILASIGWYFLVYDRDLTRDILISQARHHDTLGNTRMASWFYDAAYIFAGQDEHIAIELANQYSNDGNFTKAEYTLTQAIADGGNAELYVALSKTFVRQDKLLDAVQMLDNIADPELKAELDKRRPAAPKADLTPGLYSDYLPVGFSAKNGTIYCSLDGEYPSTGEDLYQEPISLPAGQTRILALTVGSDGLVSPLSVLDYTVGGVIEEAVFADPAMEAAVRSHLGVTEETILMTDALWTIREFTVPSDAASLEDLKLLPYVQTLHIQDMTLSSLEPLAYLEQLVTLQMKGCKAAPEQLSVLADLPWLQRLTLSDCGLSTIANLAGIQNLTYLDLSHNTLRNLEVLSTFSSLYELNLSHNAVTKLTHLSGLPELSKLDISYNAVTAMEPLAQCPKLTWLDASHNSVTKLKGLEEIPGLTYLYLAHNGVSTVTRLADCTALKELDLSNNAVTDISSLSSLMLLEVFKFAHNQVEALPNWDDGAALMTIDGSYNLLTSIDALKGMNQLSYVYMDYNQLENINAIAECYRLVTVNVYGNPISDVSKLTEHNIIVNYDPT